MDPTELPPSQPTLELCVLASGSRGNCSVLRVRDAGGERLILIDLGFSPRRTVRLMAQRGLDFRDVCAAVLTHLDTDHCHPGWCRSGAWPHGRRLLIHWSHARRADGSGVNGGDYDAWDDRECVAAGVEVAACLSAHDDLGVAVLRFTAGRASLGYATDVGGVTEEIIDHLWRVGLLAIESNYCPKMQAQSARPEFLKRRIMGGFGHLSNEESARAAALIRPGGGVVLLHLSEECNRPDLARAAHARHGFDLTISRQDEATGMIQVPGGAERTKAVQGGLFPAVGAARRADDQP